MEKIRLAFLYLYLFGLSIENWSPSGDKTDLLRPTLVVAMLYVLFSLFDIRRNLKLGATIKYLKPALMVWLWINFMSLFYFSYNKSDFTFNYTLLACIISFWILTNDLHRYSFLRNHFLIIILLNGIFLSVLSYLQIGIDYGHMERQSLLGNNSNIIAMACVLSVFTIVYFLVDNPLNLSKSRYLLLIFVPLLLQTTAKTGSKGGLIMLIFSISTYFAILKTKTSKKIPIILFGSFAFIMAFQYMLGNEVLATRWETFLETGNTTGRAGRWELAWDIFIKNPVFGVGEVGLKNIGSFVYGAYDPHNVYLYVLASGGLIGMTALFYFLGRILKQVKKNRELLNTNFFLILYVVMLMFWFKAGGGINSKLVWAYFALVAFTPNDNLQKNIR